MAEQEFEATQRHLSARGRAPDGTAAGLLAAGFEDPHEIGHGGFGVVYRCQQPELDRTVAVKVLTTGLDPENVARFVREQKAMGRVSGHPHIVTVFHVGVMKDGRPYLVMPYHSDGSLETRIRDEGPLPWPEVLDLGIKICGALETVHALGELHRDVKPANILLSEYGEPQLTDFGIARVAGAFQTATGFITGSPAFTAPEVISGGLPTVRSDLYSVGATLFTALTGHAAFERRSGERVVAQFLRMTTEPVPDLRTSGIPDYVAAHIERVMSNDPAQRPASARELGELLQDVQRHHGLAVQNMALPSGITGRKAVSRPVSDAGAASRHSFRTSSTTPPAPATRFEPPSVPVYNVVRKRLLAVLEAEQSRVVIIHAPPGSGKSTLAVQWRNHLAKQGCATVWFNADADDDNVDWLLNHFVDAIGRARPALADAVNLTSGRYSEGGPRQFLNALINAVHDAGERISVFIDDWHRVTGEESIAAMTYLVEHGCDELRLVIASRSQAGLPMNRLRLGGNLTDIDYAALRFEEDETIELLVKRIGLDVGHEDAAELCELTDGWVTALRLASLSLRGTPDPDALVQAMTGGHHAISEFLTENVLASLRPEMVEFLTATSVTEKISGGLASALTGRPDARALLAEAERGELFLHRMDGDGPWFRYHTIFSDYLRRRLELQSPERLAELHIIAAKWFAEHHMLREAVQHALVADEPSLAVDMVESDGMRMIEFGQMTELISVIDSLPRKSIATNPRLQLTLAWANVMLHRLTATQKALNTFEIALTNSQLDDDTAADLRGEADTIEAVIDLRNDRIENIEELVARCLARPEAVHPAVAAVAANLAIIASAHKPDLAKAHRIRDDATPYFKLNHGPHNAVHAHCFLGIGHREQLELDAAEEHFRTALRMAHRAGGKHTHTARLAASMLGQCLYDRGDLPEAQRLIDESYALGVAGGAPDFKIPRYVIGARIKALLGNVTEARRRLNEGARAAAALGIRRLAAKIECERIRLGISPDPGTPPMEVVSYEARWQDAGAILEELTAQIEESIAIRQLIATGSAADAERACDWASEWTHRLRGRGKHYALLQADRMLVAALFAAGRTDEAMDLFVSALSRCATYGMVRFLPDGGPACGEMLARVSAQLDTDAAFYAVPREFIDRVCAERIVHVC